MLTEFKLPELGENIHSGKVVRVLVAPGQAVRRDQSVVEVETDKAAVEVPCAVAGTVKEVGVKPGDVVSPGQVLLVVETGEAPSSSVLSNAVAAPSRPSPEPPAPAAAPAASAADIEAGLAAVPAGPSARRLARELGVDLRLVRGTQAGGRVSAEDVEKHAAERIRVRAAPSSLSLSSPALPDFSKWGPIERRPMSAVRRATAERMASAWALVPRVTQYDRADITEFEALRRRSPGPAQKPTVTAAALKIVAAALERFPSFNASLDWASGEIVLKKYCHIGVAVDTDRGLLVPVVRDAGRKSVLELSAELAEAARKARDKKLTIEEMRGATFTVTNLGGIGGTNFSPIVNWPEVAILGMARASMEPVYRDGAFAPRLMLPLSLSYDHRVIDGADGARFLRFVAEGFESPPAFWGMS